MDTNAISKDLLDNFEPDDSLGVMRSILQWARKLSTVYTTYNSTSDDSEFMKCLKMKSYSFDGIIDTSDFVLTFLDLTNEVTTDLNLDVQFKLGEYANYNRLISILSRGKVTLISGIEVPAKERMSIIEPCFKKQILEILNSIKGNDIRYQLKAQRRAFDKKLAGIKNRGEHL